MGAIQKIESVPLMPSVPEWSMMKDQANMLIESGFLPPTIKKPAQAIAIMLKGRELGVPPMQAFSLIHIIQGKPAIAAELMKALIHRNVPGAIVDILETSAARCVIEAMRPRGKRTKFSFSMEDAELAKLTGKDTWRQYPRAMLRSRCIAEMARAMFSDALMGCSYTPEELGANVDEDGNVVEGGVVVDAEQGKPVLLEAHAAPTHTRAAATPKSEPPKNNWQSKPQEKGPARAGAMDAARRAIEIPFAPVAKPELYDDGNAAMQGRLAISLEERKIDHNLWEKVGLALHGLDPDKEIDNVINKVVKAHAATA